MSTELKKLKKRIETETGVEIGIRLRKRDNAYARAVFCKVAYDMNNNRRRYSLEYIGKMINRDHATVLHNINNTFTAAIQDTYWYDLYHQLHSEYVAVKSEKMELFNPVWATNIVRRLNESRRQNAKMKYDLENIRFHQGKFADLIKDLTDDERIEVFEKVKNFVTITKRMNAESKKESFSFR